MQRSLAASMLLAAVLSGGARADDPDAAATAASLQQLLAAYDRADGGNTIPIEQAIIRLRDLRATPALVAILGHARFGFLAAWALSEIGDTAADTAVVAAFKARSDTNARVAFALSVGAFTSADARTALRAEIKRTTGPEQDAYRAALLRSRDATCEAEALAALKGKDTAKCAATLLLVGDSRREDLLPRIAALAKDGRVVASNQASSFGVVTVTKTPTGSSSSTAYPSLKTIGDFAVEAASRCVSPTTPAMVAWWYETEIAPRYPIGPEGTALLAATAVALERAAKAKARPMREAVGAVTQSVRAANADAKVQITGLAFSDRWEIRYRIGGGFGEAPGPELTATVDGEGHVGVR